MKEKQEPYLTKRIIARASRAAVQRAAERTMEVMGYNVEVIKGKVVKRFADGHTEQIEALPKASSRKKKVILD